MIRKTLIAITLLALAVMPVSAETKIGTVDIKKLFDGYWKTKQADVKLKEEAAEFDKNRKSMVDDAKKLQEDYNKLLETANDQAVAATEREKRKKAAESKLLELKGIEESVGQFDRMARTKLGEKQRSMRDKILGEIRDAINSKAKGAGYAIIFDTAAETVNATPVIPWYDSKEDITDAVLGQLNLGAPAGALKPDEAKPEGKKEEPKKTEK